MIQVIHVDCVEKNYYQLPKNFTQSS